MTIQFPKSLRFAALAMLFALAISLSSLAARADDATFLAHRAIRAKILREAGDRYAVRFLSTRVSRVGGAERNVAGVGRFRRRGKRSQRFTYHTNVNIRTNGDHDTGYSIQ